MTMLYIEPFTVFRIIPVIAPHFLFPRFFLPDETADVLKLPVAQFFLVFRFEHYYIRPASLPFLHNGQTVQILAPEKVYRLVR